MFWAEAPASLLEEAERLRNCRKRLGDLMLQAGVITKEQVTLGLEHQRRTGVRFGQAMVALNILSRETIEQFLRMQERVSTIDLSGVIIDLHLVQQLGVDFCRGKGILPLQKENFQGRTLLTLVMADPADQATLEWVQQTADCHVLPGRASEQDILAVLKAQLPTNYPRA
jgi:type IV pilus assembly protein PilB